MKHVGPRELEALIAAADVDVVDVREPAEWASGHIPVARHVPLGRLQADPRAALPRDGVVFVCAKGGRSATAAQLAERHGLTDVYSLDGGTEAWVAARLPVERVAPTEAPRVPAAPAEPEPELDAIVGANLRRHRARLGMSLDELAGRSGVSRSLVGQIELGRTLPTIGVTWRIAQALGVPFSALLSTSERPGIEVLHRADAKRLSSADGRFASRALFPFGAPPRAEFYELWLAPHGREDAEPHRPGTQENLVVTAGRLQIDVGADSVLLETGDAVLFSADVPHRYVNVGAEPCVAYLVMTYDDASA